MHRSVVQREKTQLSACPSSQTFFEDGGHHLIPEQQRGLDFLEPGVGPLSTVSADQSFKSANSAAWKRFPRDKTPPARPWWEASVRGGPQGSQSGRRRGGSEGPWDIPFNQKHLFSRCIFFKEVMGQHRSCSHLSPSWHSEIRGPAPYGSGGKLFWH